MKFRIVRNGLGEYGVVDEDNDLVFVRQTRTSKYYWGTYEEALEAKKEWEETEAQYVKRNTWEVVWQVIHEMRNRLNDLDQRLADEMKRNDDLYQDAVARINGLRNDYLADQDAAQPARIDDLEERLENLARQTEHWAKTQADDLKYYRERLEKQEQLLQWNSERQLTTNERLEKLETELNLQQLSALGQEIQKEIDTNLPQTATLGQDSIKEMSETDMLIMDFVYLMEQSLVYNKFHVNNQYARHMLDRIQKLRKGK